MADPVTVEGIGRTARHEAAGGPGRAQLPLGRMVDPAIFGPLDTGHEPVRGKILSSTGVSPSSTRLAGVPGVRDRARTAAEAPSE
ncbi:MAG: hypothetical protein AB1736_13510 [Chloroflexota bacterium]